MIENVSGSKSRVGRNQPEPNTADFQVGQRGRVVQEATPCYRANMKSHITMQGSGLDISVEQVGDRKQALLDAFQECQEGRCSCKTREYEKLESIDVQSVEDGVRIQLTPMSGETIDESAIEDCLEYTLEKATKP